MALAAQSEVSGCGSYRVIEVREFVTELLEAGFPESVTMIADAGIARTIQALQLLTICVESNLQPLAVR